MAWQDVLSAEGFGAIVPDLSARAAAAGNPAFDFSTYVTAAEAFHQAKYGIPFTPGRSSPTGVENLILDQVAAADPGFTLGRPDPAQQAAEDAAILRAQNPPKKGFFSSTLGKVVAIGGLALTGAGLAGAFGDLAAAGGAAAAGDTALIGTGGELLTAAEAATPGAIFSTGAAAAADPLSYLATGGEIVTPEEAATPGAIFSTGGSLPSLPSLQTLSNAAKVTGQVAQAAGSVARAISPALAPAAAPAIAPATINATGGGLVYLPHSDGLGAPAGLGNFGTVQPLPGSATLAGTPGLSTGAEVAIGIAIAIALAVAAKHFKG